MKKWLFFLTLPIALAADESPAVTAARQDLERARALVADGILAPAKLAEAQAAAVNLIEAASLRTETIPAPSGIGGPVDVLLVNDEEKATRLRWKSDS